jgi:ferredoxin--NADP+ reductase
MSLVKVISNKELVPNTFVLQTERTSESLIAGQCFSIGTRDLAINREYSIYSGVQEEYFEFLIRRVEGGAVSQKLCSLAPNSEVEIWGPYGNFVLDETKIKDHEFVFIATGTGIAPFNSYARSFPSLNYKIFHGIRFEEEIYPSGNYNTDSYMACISQAKNYKERKRVSDALQNMEYTENQIFYLCGNQSMISDCIAILRQSGINGDRIYTETFF